MKVEKPEKFRPKVRTARIFWTKICFAGKFLKTHKFSWGDGPDSVYEVAETGVLVYARVAGLTVIPLDVGVIVQEPAVPGV